MKKLGITFCAMALIAGCDGGNRDDDAGRVGIDSGDDFDAGGNNEDDAGPFDAGRPRDGGNPGTCGPTGAGVMCDIGNPSSCGSGMGCQLLSEDGSVWTAECFAAGTGTDGTACTPGMAGMCAEGLTCSQDEDVCRAWCCSNTDCDGGQVCNMFANANAGICRTPSSCTLPSPQTGCEAMEACNLLSSTTGEVICDSCGAGVCDVGEGSPCMFRNDCMAGMGCFSTAMGEPAACRRFCDTMAATPCPDMFMCAPLGQPANTGICVPTTT
jgi:hypothetical protein